MSRTILVSVLAAAAIGCATPNAVTYSPINAPPRPFVRRPPAEVDVTVGKPPPRPTVDVGMFEVGQGMNDDGSGKSTASMIRTLRAHAALRGCDAVQVMDVDVVGRNGWRVVRGVCEMYTDAEAGQTPSRVGAAPCGRLPGEGQSCVVASGGSITPPPCPYPLVCANSRCASPYQ